MGRPSLTRGERANRQKVGQLLKALRLEAKQSLGQASTMIGISRARLWQLETGRAPYERVLGRVTGSYGKTLEEVIRLAHNQLSLDLVSTMLREARSEKGRPEDSRTERFWARVTPEEKELLNSLLSWVRLRKAAGHHV